MIPTHTLLWNETRDAHGNSLHEAISLTYGDTDGQPRFCWRVRRVLRDNAAAWSVENTDREIAPGGEPPSLLFPGSVSDAKAWCQCRENDLRDHLGEGLLPAAPPEPESAPLVADEYGFAPTTCIRPKWSRNEGSLRMFRVWKQPGGDLEQEREITEQPELDIAIGAYYRQRMVEEHVTRLVRGLYGRLTHETPFAVCVMQAELHHVAVSSFTLHVRGANPREIEVAPPSEEAILRCVARQMHARKADLDAKIGGRDERELMAEIERSARQLGISFAPPSAHGSNGSSVLPITLEDVQAGGGDVLDLGQRNGRR